MGVLSATVYFASTLSAYAEWTADIYAGGAFTNKTDFTNTSTVDPSLTAIGVKVDSSFTGGGRLGYWLEGADFLGFGIDVFYFRAKAPSQSVPVRIGGGPTVPGLAAFDYMPVVGIGFDVLRLRLPLVKSDEFPHGQLQPYVSAGPALFITQLKGSDAFDPPGQRKTDTAVGVKVGAGMAFLLSRSVALFGEYRFTHFKAEHSFQDGTPPPSTETFTATLNTHHVVGGISFRF
jgi:opacity protein-like surface antigen